MVHAPRTCLRCGRLVRSGGSYCQGCIPRPYASAEWRHLRDSILRDWVAAHGQTCPGWQRSAHRVTPPNRLSVDHPVEGEKELTGTGGLQVLCLSCNAMKAGSTRRARPGPHRRAAPLLPPFPAD